MYTFQLQVLIDHLKQPIYDALQAEQAYAKMRMEGRYQALCTITFLSRKQVAERRRLGTLPARYILVSEGEATQFHGEIPCLPEPLPWETFQLAWDLAHHGGP